MALPVPVELVSKSAVNYIIDNLRRLIKKSVRNDTMRAGSFSSRILSLRDGVTPDVFSDVAGEL